MGVEVFELDTTDVDVAHAALNRLYAPTRPTAFTGPASEFSCRIRSVQSGPLGADTVRHTKPTGAQAAPLGYFATVAVRAGALGVRSRGRESRLPVGGVSRFPTADDFALDWTCVEGALLRIPLTAIEAAAAERHGVEQVRFTSLAPGRASSARYWNSLTSYVHAQVQVPGLDTPLVVARAVEVIAAHALVVFENDATAAGYTPEPGWVHDDLVVRAVDYIEANAHRPVTVTEIATSVGVSPWVLQRGFRARRGTTVGVHLRRVRLHNAHADLKAADPEAALTITEIARRWGFTEVAFRRYYLQEFGLLPGAGFLR